MSDPYVRTATEPFSGLFGGETGATTPDTPNGPETGIERESRPGDDFWEKHDAKVDATARRFKPDRPDYAADFDRWVQANPEGYAAIVRYAFEAKHAGKKRYSMDAIFHLVRWEFDVINRTGDFKMNNSHTAAAARLVERNVPGLSGFFEHRASQCDKEQNHEND